MTYVGLIEVIFAPLLLFTHSLLIKRPVGWIYFRPLGAVSSTDKSDILYVVLLKNLRLGRADMCEGVLEKGVASDDWRQESCFQTIRLTCAGNG